MHITLVSEIIYCICKKLKICKTWLSALLQNGAVTHNTKRTFCISTIIRLTDKHLDDHCHLVSTHVVSARWSVIQRQARLPEFFYHFANRTLFLAAPPTQKGCSWSVWRLITVSPMIPSIFTCNAWCSICCNFFEWPLLLCISYH